MARPRKSDLDDLYNEDALNHDLNPETLSERNAEAEPDSETEESMAEVGDREANGYFETMEDDESYDDSRG